MPPDRTPPASIAPPSPDHLGWVWDVFCRVIDNHGDIGVLWRLSRQLARRGHRVRLWVDNATALEWMAPEGEPGVTVYPWPHGDPQPAVPPQPPAQVWVEGFGCEIDPDFIAMYALEESTNDQNHAQFPVWINLEYLTAEAYAGRYHGLPSPVLAGPGRGATKHFFYPGFDAQTGGLLREVDGYTRGTDAAGHTSQDLAAGYRVNLFCYEPVHLAPLLRHWAESTTPVQLRVTPGRAAAAVQSVWPGLQAPSDSHQTNQVRRWGSLTAEWMPYRDQTGFDRLLADADLNLVRGEDSLVRAIWTGLPFVWQLYPQDDGAHHAKLAAFLDRFDAPASVRIWHRWWNADRHAPFNLPQVPTEPWSDSDRRWYADVRDELTAQPDLVTQLEAFVAERRVSDRVWRNTAESALRSIGIKEQEGARR